MELPIITEYKVNTATDNYGYVSETYRKKATHRAWIEPYGQDRAKTDYGFTVNSSMRIFTKTLPDKDSILEVEGEKYRITKIIPFYIGRDIHHYEILLESVNG